MMLTVACVLRSGGDFHVPHVSMLYEGVREHWPKDRRLQVVCLTDLPLTDPHNEILEMRLLHDYPKWWSKMELFAPRMESLGDLLFFDLDTVITGPLDDFVNICHGPVPIMLDDFYRPQRPASGLMYLPMSIRGQVWTAWKKEGAHHSMRQNRGDQDFVGTVLNSKARRWQQVLPDQVVSYKAHVKKAGHVPEGARVVCFHGRPRPWKLPAGLPGLEEV